MITLKKSHTKDVIVLKWSSYLPVYVMLQVYNILHLNAFSFGFTYLLKNVLWHFRLLKVDSVLASPKVTCVFATFSFTLLSKNQHGHAFMHRR